MFQALGCNPKSTGNRLDEIGGSALGALAISADGGMYLAVRAAGSITQYEPCYLGGNLEATPKGTSRGNKGVPIVVPQIAIADNEYFWGLVAGFGRARTDGNVESGQGFQLSTTNEELDTSASGVIVNGMVATANDGPQHGPMFCLFPSVGADTE